MVVFVIGMDGDCGIVQYCFDLGGGDYDVGL